MPAINLSQEDLIFLTENYPTLQYHSEGNLISGALRFKLIFDQISTETIEDEYSIKILLNKASKEGLPVVCETAGRILRIAETKKVPFNDLHLNSTNGDMCIIIPPKVKEKYPNGFELQKFIQHVEEHLYWVSYYEKHNVKPWSEYSHYDEGYLDLYLEDPKKYGSDFKAYFRLENRRTFRNKLKELKKTYNK